MGLDGNDLLKLLRSSGVQIGLWQFNQFTETCDFDQDSCQILGLSEESHGIDSILKLFSHEKNPCLSEYLMGLLKFDKAFSVTLCYELQKDNLQWIRLSGESIRKDGSHVIAGIVEDVTLSYRKEQIHLNHNIELSSFESCLDQFTIVARTDARGIITFANEEFCRLSKYSTDELYGKDHRILNSGHHSKDFFRQVWNKILSGESWRGEIKNKAKDGTFYWVDTIIVPVITVEGELKEILSFRFDITRLKFLEEENKRLKDEKVLFDFPDQHETILKQC